jgi:type II pantothenate kinase
MGLSYLFAGTRDYAEIVQIAEKGLRQRVDLTVADIYEGSIPPIPGDLTASNFGSVHMHPEREISDILASVTGLVGETVTTVSVHSAAQYGVSTIVYVGTTMAGNALLQERVASYTELRGLQAIVLENGEFSGAIGALLNISKQ